MAEWKDWRNDGKEGAEVDWKKGLERWQGGADEIYALTLGGL